MYPSLAEEGLCSEVCGGELLPVLRGEGSSERKLGNVLVEEKVGLGRT